MTAKRCSKCLQPGHDKRTCPQAQRQRLGMPEPAQADLLDALPDRTPVERPGDIVRAALREATGKTPASVTEPAGDDARAQQDAAIRSLYGPSWPIPTPAEPTPSGLDEFLPAAAGPDDDEYDEEATGRDLFPDDGADDQLDPGPPAAGAACDCAGDGDFHPPGTGGCILPSVARRGEPVEVVEAAECVDGNCKQCRPVETVELPEFDQLAEEVGIGALLDQLGEHGPQFVPWRTVRGPAEPIRISVHGVYQLGSAEYHADPWVTGSLSNSDARKLTLPGCPAQFRYDRDQGVVEHKDHYDDGHAAHREVLGVGAEIVCRPAEWKDWRTNAAKAWRAEQYAAGRTPLDPERYEMVQAMAAAIRTASPFVQQLMMQPGRAEQALFWLDRESGITRRAMVDYLPESRPNGRMTLFDYKTAESVAPDDDMSRRIYNHGYHRAAATYIDGVQALGLAEQVELVFVFQSKTPPYLVTPVDLDNEALRIGRLQNREAIETYARCVESGYWPGYTEGVETLGVPAWIEKRYQDIG